MHWTRHHRSPLKTLAVLSRNLVVENDSTGTFFERPEGFFVATTWISGNIVSLQKKNVSKEEEPVEDLCRQELKSCPTQRRPCFRHGTIIACSGPLAKSCCSVFSNSFLFCSLLFCEGVTLSLCWWNPSLFALLRVRGLALAATENHCGSTWPGGMGEHFFCDWVPGRVLRPQAAPRP